MATATIDWIAAAKARPVCNIGQIDASQLRRLNTAAKRGELFKASAPFAGRFGATKTYFAASADAFAKFQAAQEARFELYAAMDRAAGEAR